MKRNMDYTSLAPAVLRYERDTQPIKDLQPLSWAIFNDRATFDRRMSLKALVEKNSTLAERRMRFQNHEQRYMSGLIKSYAIVQLLRENRITASDDLYWTYNMVGERIPIEVHMSMFINTLETQMTPEQKSKWLPLARNFNIIGAYAQTELGHGSNVQGIETTAHFDKSTDEFILHSPTLTSRKWWPGSLGKTATHAVVHAKLILDGKSCGVQAFLVPVRDLTTHRPFPGVEVGDIGPKIGFNGVDNGYCVFTHYRIPRENMLMRFAQVTREGKYIKPENIKLMYISMIAVRSVLPWLMGYKLGQACTVATRYSIVRLQGKLPKGKEITLQDGSTVKIMERQVIDYQGQQAKLFPLIAFCYASFFAGNKMINAYNRVKALIQAGENPDIAELNASCAGLKAICAKTATDGIETCRRICGGHGFLQCSGIPHIFAETVGAVTYEGTFDVLCQQTAAYLLTVYHKAVTTSNPSENTHPDSSFVAYIFRNVHSEEKKFDSVSGSLHLPAFQIHAFEVRAFQNIATAAQCMNKLVSEDGLTFREASNECMLEMIDAAVAHSELVLVRCMWEAAYEMKTEAVRDLLVTQASFFTLNLMDHRMREFRQNEYLSAESASRVHREWVTLLPVMRENAVALTDAMNFSDLELSSDLGRFDGDVYNALIASAAQEPLNKYDVTPGYDEYLKPLITGDMPSKL